MLGLKIKLKGNMVIRLGYYSLIQRVWHMILKLKMSMMVCEKIKNLLIDDSNYHNKTNRLVFEKIKVRQVVHPSLSLLD